MSSDAAANERCGFSFPSSEAADGDNRSIGGPTAATCDRETWNDTGKCIWHARTRRKPVEQLRDARSLGPERLDGAYLAGTDLRDRISFAECGLTEANLSNSDLSGADFSRADLSGVDFAGAELTGATMVEADLTQASLAMANLTEAFLARSDLSEASLQSAKLSGAALPGADLTESNLSGVNFTEASVPEADFTDANLTSAVLDQATCRDSLFTDVIAENASFQSADLRGATFTDAFVYYADFEGSEIDESTSIADIGTYTDTEDLDLEDSERLERAIWTHHQIHRILIRNGLVREVTRWKHYLREYRVRAQLNRLEGNQVRWLRLTATRYIIRFIERPLAPLMYGFFLVVLFWPVYLSTVQSPTTGEPLRRGGQMLLFSLVTVLDGAYAVVQAVVSIFIDLSPLSPIGIQFQQALGILDLKPTGIAQLAIPIQELLGASVFLPVIVLIIHRVNLYRVAGANGPSRTSFISWLLGQ